MTNPTPIQDVPFLFEFRLSGDEEKDLRVLRIARLLPGFRQADDDLSIKIQMPLAEAAKLRDVLLDLWALVKNRPGSVLLLGDRTMSGDNELKKILIILDCATSHDVAQVSDSFCIPVQGYVWGCLHLCNIAPVFGNNYRVDKYILKEKLRQVVFEKYIFLCQYFDESQFNNYIEKFSITDIKDLLVLTNNKEVRIDQASRNIAGIENQHQDIQRAIPVTSYADIGGLGGVIQILKETVELQLKHPEVFVHLGIRPHRGVLLYGPPGCGKTLLARAVAYESGAHFFSVSGPELITKWHGESEENLRNLFAEAQKNQPSVVFFDEIDAIAQSRSSDESLRLDTRFTTQLLTLLDGIHELGRVAVLATTNRLDLLDSALLRPGRFDRIVEIPPPDREGRQKILQIHARKLPLAKDVNLEAVADALDQVTGADIAYVVREAAYASLRRSIELNEVLHGIACLHENQLAHIVVDRNDFSIAIKDLQQREFMVQKIDSAEQKNNDPSY